MLSSILRLVSKLQNSVEKKRQGLRENELTFLSIILKYYNLANSVGIWFCIVKKTICTFCLVPEWAYDSTNPTDVPQDRLVLDTVNV